MATNLEQELIAAGFSPTPLGLKGAIEWTGWTPPPDSTLAGYCTVCGCNAAYCGGPVDCGDLDPDVSKCSHWDEEAGEPDC